jgi:hypothetical protein
MSDNPVMFPPGFAKLETNPSSTGSAVAVNTIGIDLLGGFEIHHKHKLHRLLDGQVGGLCPFEYFIDVNGGAPMIIEIIQSVAHQSTSLGRFRSWVNRRKLVLCREFDDQFSVRDGKSAWGNHESLNAGAFRCGEAAFKVFRAFRSEGL